MAGKITTYTANEAANVNLGQVGCSVLTAAADSLTPPSGCVIIAIQVLEASTKIDSLVAEDPSRWMNTASAAHDQTDGTETSLIGAGGDTFPTAAYLMQGFTIYGRWTSVSVSAGAIIAYFGK